MAEQVPIGLTKLKWMLQFENNFSLSHVYIQDPFILVEEQDF